jgi:hypothetical protein
LIEHWDGSIHLYRLADVHAQGAQKVATVRESA